MLASTVSYPLAIVIACVLAGASFLGYQHVLTGDFVGSIYGGIVGGITVGHFANTSSGGTNV